MTKNNSRILFLITKSNFGGAQKQVHELALEAKKRGYEVSVACGGTGGKREGLGKLADLLSEAGIKVLPVKHFMRDISLFDEIRAFFEVIQILHTEKPDIFHVTSSKAGGLGALAGRLMGCKKIIFTSHGLTMDESWRPRWQLILISYFTWLTILLSHHTIMISTETFNRVRRMPLLSKRVSLIFNGISPIEFINRQEARQKLLNDSSTTPNILLIGGIGELHPNKNWRCLISALSLLPQNVHLTIIGEGEERPMLQTQIENSNLENRVNLLGYLNNASKYLKGFDIFVLPSKKEGLPYVLLEAGLASLPTIASNLPGNGDIIINGQNGFLIEPDTKKLADAITELVCSETKRREFGDSLQHTITRKFSIERMLDETFSLYSPSSKP